MCILFRSLSFLSSGSLLIGKCLGQVLIHEYFCAGCPPSILSKHLDRSMSVSCSVYISQWRIARTKLWKPVSVSAIRIESLVIKTGNSLSCFFDVFVILKHPQHYMLNMHNRFCILSWDHRLNSFTHSFTAEIKITDEGSLKSGNFRSCLKHKFGLFSYNLIIKDNSFMTQTNISLKMKDEDLEGGVFFRGGGEGSFLYRRVRCCKWK